MRFSILGLALIVALPIGAQELPPLPRARPAAAATETPAPPPEGPAPAAPEAQAPPAEEQPVVPLPRPRPEPPPAAVDAPVATAPQDEAAGAAPADPEGARGAEPEAPPPPRVYQTACPAVLAGQVEAEALPPIAEDGGQCHAQSPLSVDAVLANGRKVPLSGAATTDCGMASALPGWVAAVDSYLAAREDTRLAQVLVGTSYMCRNVNNGSDGNLSFHAFADAVDVVGFVLEDGRRVTVEGDWADAQSAAGRLLRFAHGAACAAFTTTLGPEANALHRDHFHLDLGCHGRSCTARICE